MSKTAYLHSSTHCLPAHALGKLRDYCFKRDALQGGAAYWFFICVVHACILQDSPPEHLPRGYTLILPKLNQL